MKKQIVMFPEIGEGLSHRNDPQPSHTAGKEMKKNGGIKDHQQMILSVLTSDPMTNCQIACATRKLGQHQVARRVSEMERKDLIKRGPLKVCPVLRRKVGTWIKR